MAETKMTDKEKLEIEALKGLHNGDLIPFADALESGIYNIHPRLISKLIFMIKHEGGVLIGEKTLFDENGEPLEEGEPIYSNSESVFSDYILVAEKHPKIISKKQNSQRVNERYHKIYEVGVFFQNQRDQGATFEEAAIITGEYFNLSSDRIKRINTKFIKNKGMKPIWNKDRTGLNN